MDDTVRAVKYPHQSSQDLIPMANGELDFGFSLSPSLKIIRIARGLYDDLMSCSGYLGSVGQIYQTGFDLIKEEGRFIHFRADSLLRSPFGVVLNQPAGQWIKDVSLTEGDRFFREGDALLRKMKTGCSISLDSTLVIDLRRILYSSPPGREILLSWIQLLTKEICDWGRFEGIGGTLILLKKYLSDFPLDRPIPVSLWSQYVLRGVRNLMRSVAEEDFEGFEKAWYSLLGLGPGLTPASDDFLVGFMSVHKLLSSSFGGTLANHDVKRRLKERARSTTVPIASQFLASALEGEFSEPLYFVFANLASHAHQTHGGDRCHPGKDRPDQIEYFLKWGHSSGTDTLTGIVFGLCSMISSIDHWPAPDN
jgi:hypothetical protein